MGARQKAKISRWINNNLSNWGTASGTRELETNFGNPAPDVLLKQVGNTPATPQTFLLLKDIRIRRASVIECDVYMSLGDI